MKLEWIIYHNYERIKPSKDIVVIIINIHSNRAAIKIFETKSDNYIDDVETEKAEKLVIIS